jgi:hypothetical protein
MKAQEIIDHQKMVLAAKEKEIEVLKHRLEFLEKCVQENVKIEVHEIHTFATPEDIENLDFPNSKCSEDK